MHPMLKRFISFEGPEACGKSTQISRLHARLLQAGQRVLLTREPGGTPLGESLRHLIKHSPEGKEMCPESELLLFAASRAQLVRRVIQPSLEKGDWVLSDRFSDSTVVFQGIARGLGTEITTSVNNFAIGDTHPSMTFLLDIPPDVSLARIARRPRTEGAADHLEDQPQDFYDRVRQGYLNLANQNPHRISVLDGTLPPDIIESKIWEQVQHGFSL